MMLVPPPWQPLIVCHGCGEPVVECPACVTFHLPPFRCVNPACRIPHVCGRERADLRGLSRRYVTREMVPDDQVQAALVKTAGNKTQAAYVLGMSRGGIDCRLRRVPALGAWYHASFRPYHTGAAGAR